MEGESRQKEYTHPMDRTQKTGARSLLPIHPVSETGIRFGLPKRESETGVPFGLPKRDSETGAPFWLPKRESETGVRLRYGKMVLWRMGKWLLG
jgi:hypothetical protein